MESRRTCWISTSVLLTTLDVVVETSAVVDGEVHEAVAVVDLMATATRSIVVVSATIVHVRAPAAVTASEHRTLPTRWISQVSTRHTTPSKPELRPWLSIHRRWWLLAVFKLTDLISLTTMIVNYVILLCWFVAVFPANSNVFHFVQRFVVFSVSVSISAAVLENSVIWCVIEIQQLCLL